MYRIVSERKTGGDYLKDFGPFTIDTIQNALAKESEIFCKGLFLCLLVAVFYTYIDCMMYNIFIRLSVYRVVK